MLRESTDILISWRNECGETLCEETVPAHIVWEIIQTDTRSEFNLYELPDGKVLSYDEFVKWYSETTIGVIY